MECTNHVYLLIPGITMFVTLLNLSTATRQRITFTGPLQYDKEYIHYNTESYIAWYLSQVLP